MKNNNFPNARKPYTCTLLLFQHIPSTPSLRFPTLRSSGGSTSASGACARRSDDSRNQETSHDSIETRQQKRRNTFDSSFRTLTTYQKAIELFFLSNLIYIPNLLLRYSVIVTIVFAGHADNGSLEKNKSKCKCTLRNTDSV